MSFQQNIFKTLNDWLRGIEGSIVNLLSGVVPWLAPIPAAYMSYQHMKKVLEFPPEVAIPVAITIEVLGFATVSTILTFWSYNRKYTDEKKQAPVGLTIFAFTFYLSIVLVMNVLIDATVGTSWAWLAVIAVRALLTLLSIPAALIVAVRTQHQETVVSSDEDKRIRAFKKQYGDNWFEMMYGKPASLGTSRSSRTRPDTPLEKKVFTYLDDVMQREGRVAGYMELKTNLSLSNNAASRLRKEWMEKREVRVDTV